MAVVSTVSTKPKVARVGIKPSFYHKAQPSGFYGFYEGEFLGGGGLWALCGFYKSKFIIKIINHNSHNQLLQCTLQFFCANSSGLKRNSLIRIKAVCISVCIF